MMMMMMITTIIIIIIIVVIPRTLHKTFFKAYNSKLTSLTLEGQ